jgi:hypothetical protein
MAVFKRKSCNFLKIEKSTNFIFVWRVSGWECVAKSKYMETIMEKSLVGIPHKFSLS